MICGKSSVHPNLSVVDYTSQSSLHPLFVQDGFKTFSPCPVLSLGFKVWDPADFLVPGFPGGSSTNLGLGDITTVPLDSSCKSLSKTT